MVDHFIGNIYDPRDEFRLIDPFRQYTLYNKNIFITQYVIPL